MFLRHQGHLGPRQGAARKEGGCGRPKRSVFCWNTKTNCHLKDVRPKKWLCVGPRTWWFAASFPFEFPQRMPWQFLGRRFQRYPELGMAFSSACLGLLGVNRSKCWSHERSAWSMRDGRLAMSASALQRWTGLGSAGSLTVALFEQDENNTTPPIFLAEAVFPLRFEGDQVESLECERSSLNIDGLIGSLGRLRLSPQVLVAFRAGVRSLCGRTSNSGLDSHRGESLWRTFSGIQKG